MNRETAAMAVIRREFELQEEFRLRDIHREFRERWSPSDPRERHEFEADFAMVMRRVFIDAQAPFVAATAHSLASRPHQDIIVGEAG